MATLQSDSAPSTFSVLVIGAGITGLTAAYRLQHLFDRSNCRLKLTVLEGSGRAGGVIGTTQNEFALIEKGPEAFVTHKPEALQLAIELGLGDRLAVCSRQAAKTSIYTDGELHQLPEGFVMFAPTRLAPLAVSPMFSLRGKLRMALDLVLPARSDDSDESLAQFVRRRLGEEALERIAEPLIAGIYSTDPERLSAECSIPRLREMEKKYGSVIRGLMNSPKMNGSGPVGTSPFVTFDDGMQVMIDALVASLPKDSLRLNTKVRTLKYGLHSRWRAICADGSQVEADAIVITVPAHDAAELLHELAPQVSQGLAGIERGASTMLTLVFKREDIGRDVSGSGFVVPAREGRSVSACSFSSQKFSKRTKDGYVMLRAFTRKKFDHLEQKNSQEQLKEELLADLREMLDLRGEPVFWSVSPPGKIPSYVVGHRSRIELMLEDLDRLEGLFLAGNSYHGVGIPDCIASAEAAAKRVGELALD